MFTFKLPSIAGLINPSELWKAVAAAFGGGGFVAILVAVLTSINVHAATIFSPSTSGLATALIGLVLGLLKVQAAGSLVVVPPPVGSPPGVQAAIVAKD